MERRFISAEAGVETRADGSRAIVGYGAVFYRANDPGTEYNLFDNLYERIMPGAFDRALAEADDVRGLFNHNPDHLLGRTSAGTMTLEKNKRGLRYEIPLDDSDPDHQRIAKKLERGDLTGSSFAFVVEAEAWRKEGDREIREITSVKPLYDVGPVTFPAYASTTAGMRADGDLTEARAAHAKWKQQEQSVEQDREAEAVAVRLRLLALDESA